MSINLSRLKWLTFYRLPGRQRDMQSVATRSWEVAPGGTRRIPPAIFPNGSLDKITRHSPFGTREAALTLMLGGVTEDAPTLAFQVDDVQVEAGAIYAGAARHAPGFVADPWLPLISGDVVNLTSAHYIGSWTGSHYFGHLLQENFPMQMIPSNNWPAIGVKTKPYAHEARYREILGLEAPQVPERAHVDHLVFYSDFAQNSFKEARYRDLRERIRTKLAPDATLNPGVYIRRGRSGEQRILLNEEELETHLESAGFTVVDPEALGVDEILRRTFGARVVIGVEGSQLSHAVYTMDDTASFLVLQPPERFAMPYKEICDRLDIPFYFIVCDQRETGFSVDLGEVDRLLELISRPKSV